MLGITRPPSRAVEGLYHGLHRPWYCGTCKALHRYYGWWSRGVLHFDIVLMGELLAAVAGTKLPRQYNNGLCLDIPRETEFLPLHRYLADLHLAFLYVQLRDAHRDSEHPLRSAVGSLAAKTMRRALANLELQGVPSSLWDDYLRAQWKLEAGTHAVWTYARPTQQLCAVLLRRGAHLAGCADRADALEHYSA